MKFPPKSPPYRVTGPTPDGSLTVTAAGEVLPPGRDHYTVSDRLMRTVAATPDAGLARSLCDFLNSDVFEDFGQFLAPDPAVLRWFVGCLEMPNPDPAWTPSGPTRGPATAEAGDYTGAAFFG